MAHLEEITVGCQLNGIAARETVTVIAVQWYGNAALEVTFKNSRGQLGSQILYRGDEATVDVLGDSLPWSFGADMPIMKIWSLLENILTKDFPVRTFKVGTNFNRCCEMCKTVKTAFLTSWCSNCLVLGAMRPMF